MIIVSGRTGSAHVTSEQFRQFVGGTVGEDSCILSSGENLEPELASSNLLRIRSGMMAHHGNISSVKIGTYDEVELANGSQGMKRIDLVVNRYTRTAETDTESNAWVVIIGTPDEDDPAVPLYTVGNLQKGDLVDDCPVFEIHYDGLNITDVKKLLSISPTNKDLTDTATSLIGESGTFTLASSISIGNYQLYKAGKIVLFSITDFRKGTDIVNGRTVGTIPEGFRPPHRIDAVFGTSGLIQGGSSNPGDRIYINTNGTVIAYCNKGTGNYLSFNASWIVD